MSDFVGFGILTVVAGSAAIGAARKIIERRRARRELREKPPLDTSVPEGAVVRVTGTVHVLDATVTAPLSGRTCVVVRSRVTAGGKLTSRAQRPLEEIAMVPFAIDRGAQGRVVVEGEHALLDLRPLHLRGKAFDRARHERFLIAQGLAVREITRAQFEETVVEPGMRVSVAGLMMKDLPTEPAADERGFRDAPATNLRIAGNVEHPLVIGEPVD
ncbi:MAG TPA: hypothetical protein VFS15_07415 [Kofleriaceae bacterium]|nr:hypothetical protein [Kofleriaceae bacterium]